MSFVDRQIAPRHGLNARFRRLAIAVVPTNDGAEDHARLDVRERLRVEDQTSRTESRRKLAIVHVFNAGERCEGLAQGVAHGDCQAGDRTGGTGYDGTELPAQTIEFAYVGNERAAL